MSLKSLISRKRKELGLTLQQIGEATGVTKGTVKWWESGEIRYIRTDKLEALGNILQMDPTKVLEEIVREEGVGNRE